MPTVFPNTECCKTWITGFEQQRVVVHQRHRALIKGQDADERNQRWNSVKVFGEKTPQPVLWWLSGPEGKSLQLQIILLSPFPFSHTVPLRLESEGKPLLQNLAGRVTAIKCVYLDSSKND